MNFKRRLYIIATYPNRLRHRLGFGVQSPSDYELVRDVLFESLRYYAYDDEHLTTKSAQQLWRIKNRFRDDLIVLEDDGQQTTDKDYENIASNALPETMLLIEGIDEANAELWTKVLEDPRATVTFDLINRGLISFNPKRIKQNYTL